MTRLTHFNLYLSIAVMLALALLVACGSPGAPEDTPAAEESAGDSAAEAVANVPETEYNESPMLAQRVAAGELPNVETGTDWFRSIHRAG